MHALLATWEMPPGAKSLESPSYTALLLLFHSERTDSSSQRYQAKKAYLSVLSHPAGHSTPGHRNKKVQAARTPVGSGTSSQDNGASLTVNVIMIVTLLSLRPHLVTGIHRCSVNDY